MKLRLTDERTAEQKFQQLQRSPATRGSKNVLNFELKPFVMITMADCNDSPLQGESRIRGREMDRYTMSTNTS